MGKYRGRHYDPNYAERHGLIKREEVPSTASRIKERFAKKIEHYKQRNTPERRRERITNMALEAREEELKTKIYRSKQARGGSTIQKIITGGGYQTSSRRSSGGRTRKAMRSSRPPSIRDNYQPYQGMDDLFGTGNSQITRMTKQKSSMNINPHKDMDALFS